MFGFFKRKKAEDVPHCFHRYLLSDYENFYDACLDVSESYKLVCENCGDSRWVDEYTYDRLRELGIARESI
ncbi:hypothetical protein GCM10011346_33510 [Oceanobacillus neutriphilus]|uniref:Zinc ribbon domain-containing protein n=1 Tax=Oceanobacillus neutriphilus TaxID=531815 RepID=A0ABQ2NY62_9BACI|nr:hypothetical protein GCM10011346_33510 [Oceanobacillus neutriphilus]